MAAQLQRADTEQNRFLADLAHEEVIRRPRHERTRTFLSQSFLTALRLAGAGGLRVTVRRRSRPASCADHVDVVETFASRRGYQALAGRQHAGDRTRARPDRAALRARHTCSGTSR
jgi:hypothetical protein